MLTDLIPATARKWVYAIWALIGVVLGSLQVAGQNVDTALAVYAYVSTAVGLTAASNTTTSSQSGRRAKLDDVEEV